MADIVMYIMLGTFSGFMVKIGKHYSFIFLVTIKSLYMYAQKSLVSVVPTNAGFLAPLITTSMAVFSGTSFRALN